VRKVVPTLTSTSAEIYLSMAGAKQFSDISFILVPAGVVRPAGVCSRHCIVLHHGACRGELQAWRERRWCLQVPEVRLRQGANIMVKAENVQVCNYLSSPVVRGPPPPFIDQGEAAYSRVTQFQLCVAVWGIVPWSGWPSGQILLLAGRCGESCACPGAASRVAVWEPLIWPSSVRRLEGHADGGLEVTQ
jgi:hypothetical protein